MLDFFVKIGQALLFGILTPDVLDRWVKVAQTAQGLMTPAIAIIIGVITWQIQRQQVRTQQQQAETNHRQYRLALLERRMKVFDATMDFIGLILRHAAIEEFEPIRKFIRDTREHHLFFVEMKSERT